MTARLVYSSGPGGGAPAPTGACPRCGARPCRCPGAVAPAPSPQSVRVRRERAGRKGKTVTLAAPLLLGRGEAGELLAELKRACGAGGALKEVRTEEGRAAFALELQGDHVAAVVERLRARGFRATAAS